MSRAKPVLSAVFLLFLPLAAAASDLDDRMNDRLRGAWAVLGAEIYSGCSGTYSDNQVGSAGVSSKAGRRFSSGELVKIDKVKVKRSRIDLLTTIAVPVLSSYTDGPFELYEELECRVQLIFELPREVVKHDDVDAILQTLGRTVTTFPDRRSAEASDLWNRRRREEFPPGYELTLARYQHWKAEQTNAAVAERMDRAAEDAADVADDIDRDADYLDGFAAGAEEMRNSGPSGCSGLIAASFSTYRDRPRSDKSSDWKRGFEDGQQLVFNVLLLDGLRHCFVPVPPPPAP